MGDEIGIMLPALKLAEVVLSAEKNSTLRTKRNGRRFPNNKVEIYSALCFSVNETGLRYE